MCIRDRCQFGSKFPVEGVVPNNHSSCRKTRMNVLSCGIIMWAQVSFVLSQCSRLTDGQKGFRHTVSCITCSRTEKNAQPLFSCKRCKITPFNFHALAYISPSIGVLNNICSTSTDLRRLKAPAELVRVSDVYRSMRIWGSKEAFSASIFSAVLYTQAGSYFSLLLV